MSQYIEATQRTRQQFFLAVICFAGLCLAIDRYESLIAQRIQDRSLSLVEVMHFVLMSTIFSSLFFFVLIFFAIHYARRAIQSKQWPPLGMKMPFRTKVRIIKNPTKGLLYLFFILLFLSMQIALPWVKYVAVREQVQMLKKFDGHPVQQGSPADGFAAAELQR